MHDAAVGRGWQSLVLEMRKIMNSRIPARIALSLLSIAVGLSASSAALAGPADTVYQPNIENGEWELEFRGGYRDFNDGPSEHAFIYELGYAPTNNWRTEVVLEYAAEEGNRGKLEAWEWENVFLLTEQGKYWADVGLFFEYENGFKSGPDEFKIGPMFQKEVGPTLVNLNLLFAREVGHAASGHTELEYTWQVKWRGNPKLEWGMQGIGSAGEFGHLGEEDAHSMGPALFGTRRLADGKKLKYSAALMGGLNAPAPDVTARVELEYEFH
jgi:hypothetical protein